MAQCRGYNGYRKITGTSNVERGCFLDGPVSDPDPASSPPARPLVMVPKSPLSRRAPVNECYTKMNNKYLFAPSVNNEKHVTLLANGPGYQVNLGALDPSQYARSNDKWSANILTELCQVAYWAREVATDPGSPQGAKSNEKLCCCWSDRNWINAF
ncbi:hypothetical protein J6590_006469 [Homalodisca vitripennis]|nr:hypothetical protein J6590_006469 [Homalodisca vitripennis]